MRNLIILLILPTLLLARQKTIITHPNIQIPYEPWFTGPALAPTAVNMKLGHPALEPVVTLFDNYGSYNNHWKLEKETTIWTLNYLIDFQFATSERTGVEIIASFNESHRKDKTSTHFTDTILLLGYQVSDDQKDSWVPDFRLFFETFFPTGKFRQLKPENFEIDATGQGAYFFGPNFSFQKLFYLDNHFFVLHWSLGYFFPTRARLKETSAYGGGPGTRGTIRPGQLLTAFLSGEYSLNQRWVLSFDTAFVYQQRAKDFRGTTLIPVASPTTVQLSFSPQIQYNLSPQSGFLFGSWFTLTGRNADAFASLFAAFTHVF